MYNNVLHVSYYLIDKHNELYPDRITNSRLQQLLYFVQCHFLIETGKPCFYDPIVAWPMSAVVPKVWERFEIYGHLKIDYYFGSNWHHNSISKEDLYYITDVIKIFRDKNEFDLGELIRHQTPWIEAIKKGIGEEIEISSIKKFFLEDKL